ncbi:MAG TPA: hypothetical protein PKE47_06745, partial [Verrucomicrobiota bacterium]|nr:hypothetical protein [Verrucomicrobiota bacterium]
MLYVDIPNHDELLALASHRDDASVSLYLPTTPVTPDADTSRIQLKNLARDAARGLEAKGVDKRRVAALAEQLDDLGADAEFWRFQAHGLAVLATPDNLRTFRVPTTFTPVVVVADRFFLKPLLRAVTFRHSGYVLAFAEGAVRLVEVSADLPAAAVKIEGLPTDAASALGRATLVNDPMRRVQGGEGQKLLFRQYARKVDAALRPLLAGSDLPLILAAKIYRSVSTYPHLAAATLGGSPDRLTDAELAAAARPVLDALNQQELAAWRELFARREPQGRASTDIANTARAATMGAVDSLLVDIDAVVPG